MPNSEQATTDPRDDRLADALESFLAATESAGPFDRSSFLRQHPDIADELTACIESLDFIDESLGRAPADTVLEPGQEFGDYRILREIGRGGMGVVYEAFHAGLERRVALKVLSGRDLEDETHRERFLREAKTAAGLHHTNIVPIFEVGDLDGTCYYSMQFIEGKNLRSIVHGLRGGQADPSPAGGPEPTRATLATGPNTEEYFREVAGLIAQSADALAHAHSRGVVHRDIKPSNLIVDPAGTVWITDFGLAFRMSDVEHLGGGEPAGTPLYMSPEQASPGPRSIDLRTDIYSLGATLYELLTLRPMFEAQTSLALLAQIVSVDPEPPRRRNRQIPRDLDSILRRATAKRPEDRYADAAALAADLRRYVNHEPVSVRRIGPAGRLVRWCRREPTVAPVTAVSTALLLLLAGWAYWSIHRERDAAVNAAGFARRERDRAAAAETVARENLWDSLYQQTRATLLSVQTGRRWAALDLIAKAQEIRPDRVLRDEAIAALSITDARLRARLPVDSVVELVAFSNDGQRIVCGCRDGSIKLWELDRSDEPVVLAEPTQDVNAVAISPCGRRVATAVRDGPIDVWNIDTRQLIASLEADDFRPVFVTFLSATRLVAVGFDGTCRQWTIDDDGAKSLPAIPLGRLRGIARGPGTNSISVLNASGELETWELDSGSRTTVPGVALAERSFANIVWGPTGKSLAVAQRSGTVDLWSTTRSQPVESLGGHRGPVRALAFSGDGRMLASSGMGDPGLKLWDVATGSLLATLTDPHSGMWSASFSPDGRFVAAGGWDKTLWVWEIVPAKSVERFAGHGDAVQSIAFTPDDRQLASGSADGSILLWSPAAGTEPRQLAPPADDRGSGFRTGGCAGLAISPDGRLLAVRTFANAIRVYDIESGSVVATLDSGRMFWGGNPAFLPGGRELVRSADRSIQRWLIGPDNEPTTVATASDRVVAMTTSRDGSRAAVIIWGDRIEVFNLESGERVGDALKLDERCTALALSPDPAAPGLLALGDRAGFVHLYRPPALSPVRMWKESDDEISSLAFSPDGRLLAVAGRDGVVSLLQVSDGELLARFPGHPGGVRSVAFSPDGSSLATCGDDKLIQLWRLPSLRGELAELGLGWETEPNR